MNPTAHPRARGRPWASCSSWSPSWAARGADPVQARLTQLGSMQAKTLEELELQQPFFERTVRPLALAPVGHRPAVHERQEGARHREAAGDGRQPGRPAHGRLPRPQGGRRRRGRGRRCSCSSASSAGNLAFGIIAAPSRARGIGFFAPEFWLSRRIKKRRKPILLARPGHARPADHLGPRRPRLRRRAGQGRREDQGPAGRRVPARARRDPRRQGTPGGAARHRRRAPRCRR